MRKTLLITILAFLFAINANSQCTIIVPSTHGYFVNVTLKATSVVATTPCVYGYNYNVAVEYSVTFTGVRIPSKLNTLQGNLYCGASPNFFSLPTTGGSGTVLSRSNVWSANTDCASASVSSLRCNTFELQIQGPGISNQFLTCGIVLPPVCYAGTTAPALNASTKSNICPASTVNLSNITASNTPSNTVLEWHSATPATALNKVLFTGNVNAGTYYAVFYDAINNCYSNSTPVYATVTPCCQVGNSAPNFRITGVTNICPLLTADLTTLVATNIPVGAILEFHSATPVSASTKISLAAAINGGTYYAVFHDVLNDCYSNTTEIRATITPCCNAGIIAPNLNTTTIVNSCPIATANLTTISANNTPIGAVLEWHTSANISASNKVNSLTSVSAGVYFAVFFDALNNCYSNASAAVNVAVSSCSGISSGNEGGLESDGCLAESISKRNYQRIKTPSVLADGKAISYDNPRDLQMFNEPVKGALGTRGDAELESFIPLKPFANTATAFITSPNDLIGVTNAKKVLSVDYFDNTTQKRLAAVLTTKTVDKVYDHTKVICDRLIGSQLLSTQRIVLDNKPFIMSVLQRENGAIEYNINFSVNKVNATTATVTSQWAIDEYPSKPDYWNFQVWAQSPDLTQKLAIEILNKFKEQFATLNSTIEPSIPKVFVKKGSYDNGTLTLVIQNPIGAKRITLSGNYTSSETNKRETLSKTVTLSGANEETIELVVGSIFDFGFTLRNEKSTEYDALYFADGAWGLDYNKNVSKVESYEVNSVIPFFQDGVFTVERTPILRGVVKDYVSLFRSLRPASMEANLSGYKNLSFKASGTSVVEVTLVKKSITDWSKQYRTEIKLYNEKQDYSLALKDFSNGTNEPIKADDLVDIVFTIKGDGKTSKPFEITVDNVVFDNKTNSTLKAGAVLTAFPNPASESTELIFNMPERGVSEISLTNTNGKKVIQRTEEFAKGNNRIMLMLNTLPSGIYIASITTAKGKITTKVIIP